MAKWRDKFFQKENDMADQRDRDQIERDRENQKLKTEDERQRAEAEKARQSIKNLANKVGPQHLKSPTQEEVDKAKDSVFREETENEETHVKTILTSVSEDEANKAKERQGRIPTFQNETQSLTGTPGNTNLTQNGRLAGDKSVRADRSLDEINEELNLKAGPNPLPNREGNELTKAMLAITPVMVSDIDQDTNAMAKELAEIRENANLSGENEQKLKNMENRLQNTGRIA